MRDKGQDSGRRSKHRTTDSQGWWQEAHVDGALLSAGAVSLSHFAVIRMVMRVQRSRPPESSCPGLAGNRQSHQNWNLVQPHLTTKGLQLTHVAAIAENIFMNKGPGFGHQRLVLAHNVLLIT